MPDQAKYAPFFSLFLLAVFLCSAGYGQTAGVVVVVVEGGTLIDGTGALPVANAAILIENGRIQQIGKQG